MISAMDEQYEVVQLFGQQALFSNFRIDRATVPEGMFCYDIRHGDDGSIPGSLELSVYVNHMGTVICGVDFGLTQNSYIPMDEDDLGFESLSDNLDNYMKTWKQADTPLPVPIQDTPFTPPTRHEAEYEDEPEL